MANEGKKEVSAEFTDAQGNPVQVENHPEREKRTDYTPQERPQRPARKEK